MSNFVGTPKLICLCFIHFYLMFLLMLLICKLYKSNYIPLGKRSFSRDLIGTKFDSLQHVAIEI